MDVPSLGLVKHIQFSHSTYVTQAQLFRGEVEPHDSVSKRYCVSKELHHKKAVTKLFGVRRSRLGPIQSQAVL